MQRYIEKVMKLTEGKSDDWKIQKDPWHFGNKFKKLLGDKILFAIMKRDFICLLKNDVLKMRTFVKKF